MKSKILLLLFLPLTALAFDKDFHPVNDQFPHEFNLLFDSLKLEIKTPSEQIKLVGLCKDLNEHLGFLQKEHIFLLVKTQVMKDVLEHKFTKVRQFDMNTLLLKRLEEDFDQKKKYLNRFSQWIWQSIIGELKHRKTMGLITDKSFSARAFEGAKLSEALRFERYLTYLFPWIDRMDSLNASEFNQLAKEISWVVLEHLDERSLLFERYASTATGKTKVTLFNIPQKLLELPPEDIKRMQNNQAPLTLQEKSAKEKAQASEMLEKVTPTDMSPVSEDVAKELEKKSQD